MAPMLKVLAFLVIIVLMILWNPGVTLNLVWNGLMNFLANSCKIILVLMMGKIIPRNHRRKFLVVGGICLLAWDPYGILIFTIISAVIGVVIVVMQRENQGNQ